jgi:hypothetical protein
MAQQDAIMILFGKHRLQRAAECLFDGRCKNRAVTCYFPVRPNQPNGKESESNSLRRRW